MTMNNEKDVLKIVYDRFLSFEEESWSHFDELMEYFEFLKNEEVIVEAALKMQIHEHRGIKCCQDHGTENCFAPTILSAVSTIVELYSQNGFLSSENRYILVYYMVLCELKIILSANEF
jgi:hypothetical protein